MAMFPLRVRFADAERAHRLFDSFPPGDLEYIEGWSRKRDGDSQIMLLHLETEARLQDFITLCRSHPEVVEVVSISEDEFWRAPSNAV